jgi:hypothetical protein
MATQILLRAGWDQVGVQDRLNDVLQPRTLPHDLVTPRPMAAQRLCHVVGDAGLRAFLHEPTIGWRVDRLHRKESCVQHPTVHAARCHFTNSGRRSIAEAIQLAGRERARAESLAHRNFGARAWLTILSYVAGYGIGLYTFRMLWWVLFFTLIGFVFLCFSSNARAHGVVWRLGASLHRLLPIVKLSKEFEDFYDNPSTNRDWPRNLNRFQVGYLRFNTATPFAGFPNGLSNSSDASPPAPGYQLTGRARTNIDRRKLGCERRFTARQPF